jgi:hypothetical protein
MKYEFDVGYDRITNFDAPGYVPKEISTFLTRAQEEIVHEVLGKMSAYDEKNKKAMSRLRQVIPLSTFVDGNYPFGFISPLQVSVAGIDLEFGSTGGANWIMDNAATGRFLTAGFRVGDVITVVNSPTQDGTYTIITLTATRMDLSSQTLLTNNEFGLINTVVSADPVLRVRNERADILLTTNFYYNRIPVVPATEPVTYNNAILDVQVDPIDDDFYGSNKDNPYKKPNIEKIWRIDSADESSKEHEYITDGTFDLTTIHLHIDRKPRPIIVPETTGVIYATTDGSIDGIYFMDYNFPTGASNPAGLNCQLDPIIHREIVDRAIKLAYAALQDEKGFQISTVQEQQQ